MHLSQKTPLYYAQYPLYDRALPRICNKVKEIDNKLFLIDIGANIGDTVALVSELVDDASILCVEGNTEFLYFLKQNTASIKNNQITIEYKFCVETLVGNQFKAETKNGTAHLSVADDTVIENIDTLDNMIERNRIFYQTNILKIDTDGFEIAVLNGAKNFLNQSRPIIYFEFTPDAYVQNKQNPMDLIDLLVSLGYKKALFYNNFGLPIGVYDFTDKGIIKGLIDKIDLREIHYYDILCLFDDDYGKYLSVISNELSYGDNKTILNS
ncbi:hypothetical protein AGMMS49959_16730 [Planctomycetales bacterium]|nr:hypothetical protein AGMMS49959_16730 [Planctomycetales bacterium]